MIGRYIVAMTLSASLAAAQTAAAQGVAAAASGDVSNGKAAVFDVVSIKPGRRDEPGQHFGFGPTGYTAVGVPLSWVIYQAFFVFNTAGKDPVTGAPDWVSKDIWDIQAKVAPEDLAAYQKDLVSVGVANPINRQMLQTMLVERCKLVVHRMPVEMPGYALVIARTNTKPTEARSDESRPSEGIPLDVGGFLVPYHRGDTPHISLYGVSMSTLTLYLSQLAGRPVVDRTGLSGKYDFVLNWLSLDPDEREGFVSSDDPDRLSHWNFGALGLRVEHIQVPTEHIVIDHIEKPSQN